MHNTSSFLGKFSNVHLLVLHALYILWILISSILPNPSQHWMSQSFNITHFNILLLFNALKPKD